MKVIIVGGVAGGASCAARLRRLDENAEIVVFEKSGFVSYANCGPALLRGRDDRGKIGADAANARQLPRPASMWTCACATRWWPSTAPARP